MIDLVTADQAKELTEPFHALWLEAHRTAEKRVRAIRDLDTEAFLAYEPPTIARMVHDQVVRSVRLNQDVSGSTALGTFAQIVNGKDASVVVRFKELDQHLRRFNHVSGRQDLLDHHRFIDDDYSVLTDDGLQHVPTLLSCGYVRDFDIVSITRVVVVCHLNREPIWTYGLDGGTTREVLLFPNVTPPQSMVVSRTQRETRSGEAD